MYAKYEPFMQPEQLNKTFIKQAYLNDHHKLRKDYVEILRKTYNHSLADVDQSFESFNTKDAVVWIDPLDGTSDFVKGNISAVTVLIGLSLEGHSRVGIVHNPFLEGNHSVGQTIIGTAEHGAFRIHHDEKFTPEEILGRDIEYLKPYDVEEQAPEDFTFRVACTISHFSQDIKNIIETIAPVEIKRIGGAGNKCINVAIQNADAYIHPTFGLKYWDLCASEVLIKAMGGFATNIKEERLTYSIDGDR